MKILLAIIVASMPFVAHSQDNEADYLSVTEEFQIVSAPVELVKPAIKPKPRVVKVVPRAQLAAQQRLRQVQRDNNLEFDEEDIVGYEELPAHRGYSRPKLVADDVDDVSDDIMAKLALARERALEVYRNKWV